MPSISVRGATKDKFQAACKRVKVSMKKKLEELLNKYMDEQPDIREQGIRAIIHLQGLMGIKETRTDAEFGWDNMSVEEQNDTLSAYLATQGQRPKVKIITFNCDDAKGAEKTASTLHLPGYKFKDMNINRTDNKAIVRFERIG